MTDQSLPTKPSRCKWTDELAVEMASNFPTQQLFRAAFPWGYQHTLKHGLGEQAFKHMPPVRVQWTDEKAVSQARNFETQRDLRAASPGCRDYIRRRGLAPVAYAHMKTLRSSMGLEEAISLAKTFKNRKKFREAYPSAFTKIVNEGRREEAFLHMVPHPADPNSVYFWEALDLGVFKFGIGTIANGDTRIKEVARAAGVTPNIITHFRTTNPRKTERQLLKLGRPVEFPNKFDGYTEFRHLTGPEILDALRILSKATT